MSLGWPDSLQVDSRDTPSLLMRSVLTACPLVVLTLYQALPGHGLRIPIKPEYD